MIEGKPIPLFDLGQSAKKPSNLIRTVYRNEPSLINDIMWLHNGGQPIELDPTYSKGIFWKEIAKPTYKFDLHPQSPDVEQADCRDLPFGEGEISSIMFDPPFVIGKRSTGIIKERFEAFDTLFQLKSMYADSLTEFYRILKDKGLLVFKCQDMVQDHKQFWSHVWIINTAVRLGFYTKDLFVLVRDNVILSSHVQTQVHARKTHCYFLVFVKQKTHEEYIP